MISFGAINFLSFFYFSHFCENRDFSLILFIGPYVTIQRSQDVTQIDPEFYDASFCILFCLRERKRERERKKIKREKEKERQRETYTPPPHTHTHTHRPC